MGMKCDLSDFECGMIVGARQGFKLNISELQWASKYFLVIPYYGCRWQSPPKRRVLILSILILIVLILKNKKRNMKVNFT